jgi:hypothetical protein
MRCSVQRTRHTQLARIHTLIRPSSPALTSRIRRRAPHLEPAMLRQARITERVDNCIREGLVCYSVTKGHRRGRDRRKDGRSCPWISMSVVTLVESPRHVGVSSGVVQVQRRARDPRGKRKREREREGELPRSRKSEKNVRGGSTGRHERLEAAAHGWKREKMGYIRMGCYGVVLVSRGQGRGLNTSALRASRGSGDVPCPMAK